MAYTTINKSTDYFNTLLYTGNDTDGRAITGVGFQPDWVWFKGRNVASDNEVFDAVRGATKYIATNATNAEATNSNRLQSFDTDGFTLGNSTSVNKNYNYITWNWRAGNSSGSSNSDGSTSSTVSASTTSGFSIVKWTPSGSAETVGHGLGSVPKMIITKNLGASQGWFTYHHSIGNTKYLLLNSTAAEATDSNAWNNTTPTSSVFSVGSQFAGSDYVAYCFAEKTGFSKFGSYVGNGNTDGPFIYTGFKPAFIMYHRSNSGTSNWGMHDSVRDIDNPVQKGLIANTSAVEDTHDFIDFLSNGFKLRSSSANRNGNGDTYIYMAFAAAPLVGSNNVPCTAR